MKKRILISIVAITLCFVICLITTASTPISTVTAFIDEELKTVMENAADDELIPVDIWITEVDTNEVETEVMKSIGDTKVSLLSANSTTAVTHAQVDAYIETEREIYAEMQAEESQTFLNRYNGIFNSRSSTEKKLLFVSEYTPVIRAKLTKNEINKIATDAFVNSIYHSPDIIIIEDSNISIPLVHSNYVRDTLGYSGSGIKIGLLEAGGVPNRTKNYFISSNIIYDPDFDESYETTHANMVAAIMIGKATTVDGVTYKGIVPDAKLYATKYIGNNTDDWRARVEWLLSQGVHVINMSGTFSNVSAGIYDTHSKWIDHVAINHSVHFVKSAGNNGGNITSPGLAYNIITVGNLNDNNSSAQADDEIRSTSSYIEPSNHTNKPDLVAPGTNIATAVDTDSGTSFAAPHVTAIIAQLCQAYPTLKTKQDAMKAILMASITHSKHAYTPDDDEFDKYGAGVVDAQTSLSTASNSRYVSSNFAANAEVGTTSNYTFTVSSTNKNVRVALTWLMYNRFISAAADHEDYTQPSQLGSLANLCVWVYNPSGTIVAGGVLDYGNIQVVDFMPTQAGTYRIEVEIWDNSAQTCYYGLAWKQ